MEELNLNSGFSHGQAIPIISQYRIGDLVCFNWRNNAGEQMKSYSKIIKIIPKFLENTNILNIYFVMENRKFISITDITSLEKMAPDLTKLLF